MRGGIPLALIVLSALLIPGASAQDQAEGCRPPVLTLQSPPATFEPGAVYHLMLAIENPNGPPIDAVRTSLTTAAPAGWSATTSQRELTMGPRDVAMDVLAIAAPHRGTGERSGNITLLVTFVCTSGDVQTSASRGVLVEAEIEDFSAPWPLVLIGFLVLAAGVTALGIRRLRRGVAMSCSAPERLVAPGKSAKFELLLENRRGRPQGFDLRATGLPEGWQVHLALEEVDLEPGEEKMLWVLLRAPPDAAPGAEALITMRLEGRAGSREGATTALRARVSASIA